MQQFVCVFQFSVLIFLPGKTPQGPDRSETVEMPEKQDANIPYSLSIGRRPPALPSHFPVGRAAPFRRAPKKSCKGITILTFPGLLPEFFFFDSPRATSTAL